MKKIDTPSNKVGLLSQEDEVKLSKLIQAGNQAVKRLEELGEIVSESDGEMPSASKNSAPKAASQKTEAKEKAEAKEIQKLWAATEKGRQAADHFALANMRLVSYLAKQYMGKSFSYRYSGLYQDVIQEGYLALVQAVKRFNPSKGIRFSTYASKWIYPAIKRAVKSQTRTMKMPAAQFEEMLHLNQICAALEQKLNRNPTIQELSKESQISPQKVEELLQAKNRMGYLSLEYEVDKGAGTLGDNLEYSDDLMVLDSVVDADMQKFFSSKVHQIMGELDDLSKEILEMRFGLNGNPPMGVHDTAKAVSEKIGNPVTAARIRHLESKALDKIKAKAPDLGDI